MRAKLQKGTKTRRNRSLAKPGFPWQRRACGGWRSSMCSSVLISAVPLLARWNSSLGPQGTSEYVTSPVNAIQKCGLWIWLGWGCALNGYGDIVYIPNVNESRPHVAYVCSSVVTMNVKASFARLLIERHQCYSHSFHCTWRHTKPCYNIINTRWRHH